MKRKTRMLVALSVAYVALGTAGLGWWANNELANRETTLRSICIVTPISYTEGMTAELKASMEAGEKDCLKRIEASFADQRRGTMVRVPLVVIVSWIAILALAWAVMRTARWIKAAEE